jgi:L-asparaginase
MQKVLLIYTGGTIGMIQNPEGFLEPANQSSILKYLPDLSIEVDFISVSKIQDSADIHYPDWLELCKLIQKNYQKYCGMVVLHGTDTMTYTASALSFMLQNLQKAIVFTGSQLPISASRTDARDNLITAIQIAAAYQNNNAVVQEVCIFFENELLRANRSVKYHSENFNAFKSPNYPSLANSGIQLKFNESKLLKNSSNKSFELETSMEEKVALYVETPTIHPSFIRHIFDIQNYRGVIMELYGSGNFKINDFTLKKIQNFIHQGGVVQVISQCIKGGAKLGEYQSSNILKSMGVLDGKDQTRSASICKMMYVLGKNIPLQEKTSLLSQNLKGEITN